MWRRRAACALSLSRCVRRAAATVSVVTSTTAADDATVRRCARRSAAVAVSGETIARVLYSYRQCADDDDDDDSGSLRAQQQHWQEQQQQQQHNSGDDDAEEDNVTALLSSVTSRRQQQQQEQQQQSPRRAEEDALRDVLDALIALPPQHSLRAQWATTACQLAHRNGLHAHCIELYFVCVRDTLSMLADALPPTTRSDAAATAKATMTAQPPLLLVALTTAHDDALLTMVMQSAALLRDAAALRRCYDVVLHLTAHERRALSSSSSSGRWCAGRAAVHASRLFALCALLALRAASSCRDVAAGDVYRVVAYDALAFVLLPPSSTAHAKQQEQQWHRRGGHGNNNNDNDSGEDEARARRRCCRRHLDELMHTVQYSSSSSSSSSTMSQHNTLTTASIDAVSAAVLIYLFHRWCDVYDRVDNDPATATKGRPLRAWLRPAVLHALLHAGVAQRRLDVCELAALYIDRYVAESTADDAVGTAAAARTATTTSPPPPRAGNDGKDVGEALSSLVPLMLRFFAMTATAAATTSQQQQQQQQNASATRARRWLQWLRATQPRWQPPRHAVVAMARVAGSVRDVALATWCLEALLSSGDVGGSGGAMTASSPPPLLVLPPSAADVFVCVSAVAQCGVTEGQLHSVIRVLHEHALLRLRDEEALYVRLLRCARDAGARATLDDVLLPQLLSHLSRSSSSTAATGGGASGGDDDAWLLAARAPRGVVTRGGGAVPLTMQCVYAALVALHACGHARFFAYYVQFCRLHDARRMTAAAMRVERARWAAVALRWAIEQHGGRASGDGRYDEQAGDAAAVRGIARDAARQLMALGGVALPASSPAALRRALRETTATLQRHCAALRAQHSPAWWRRCFAVAATSRDDKGGGGAAAAVVDEAARALFAPLPTSRAPPSLCVLPSVASPSFARPLLRRRCALRGCAADAATLFARTTMALHTAGGDGNGAVTHATRAARARWQGGVLS